MLPKQKIFFLDVQENSAGRSKSNGHDLHNVCFSKNDTRMIKSTILVRAGHVPWFGNSEMINACNTELFKIPWQNSQNRYTYFLKDLSVFIFRRAQHSKKSVRPYRRRYESRVRRQLRVFYQQTWSNIPEKLGFSESKSKFWIFPNIVDPARSLSWDVCRSRHWFQLQYDIIQPVAVRIRGDTI
jgi:hypothetical protein